MNQRAPIRGRWGRQRRTSFARRDMNLALVGALVAGVVLALALLLLLLARINPDQGARARGAILDILSPVTSVLLAPVRGIAAGLDRLGDHFDTVDRLRALEAEVAERAAAAERARRLEAELAEAERLLKLHRPERRLVASAFASASAATPAARSATISAGARAGVRPRMPVIAADGLLGRVTDVGLFSARVMLLTDPNSRVPVRVERLGWTGILAGTGASDLQFQHDPGPGTDRLAVGDRLVTSGDGGLFPPAVPVAVVVDVAANPPRARPLARPTGLGRVRIEAPWLPPPQPVPTSAAADEPDQRTPEPAPRPAPAAAAPAGLALPAASPPPGTREAAR
ncbi:rod shape-determining protein MreC [Thermaurantiacus sp.]